MHTSQIRIGLGRFKDDEMIDDEDGEYFDGGSIEDYEDPKCARPSDVGGIDPNPQVIYRLVDLIIIRLKAKHFSFESIGKVLNRSKSYVWRRYYRIPEDIRRFYGNSKAHESFFALVSAVVGFEDDQP